MNLSTSIRVSSVYLDQQESTGRRYICVCEDAEITHRLIKCFLTLFYDIYGALRVFFHPFCAEREILIFCLQGPKGDMGETGPPGERGEKGEMGLSGPAVSSASKHAPLIDKQ